MKLTHLGSINRTLFILVLVTMLPVVAILFYSGFEHRNLSVADAKKDVFLMTNSMAEIQKDLTHSVRQTLTVLSLLTEIQSLKGAKVSAIFKSIVWQNHQFHNIALVGLDGEIIASAIPYTSEVNLGDRKHIKEAIETKHFSVGEFVLGKIGNSSPIFPYAFPVFDENLQLIAVLSATIKLDYFSDFHEFANMPENSFISVTDHNGVRLLYYPAKITNPIGKPIQSTSWLRAKNLVNENDFGSFSGLGSDGIQRIFAFEQIRISVDSAPYMYVWVGVPEKDILRPARQALFRNLVLLLACMILSFIIFLMIGKKVLIEPIHRLVDLTQKIAEGRLTACLEPPSGPDELRVLNDAFFDMATELTNSQKTIHESEYRFREIFNNMTNGVVIFEPIDAGDDFFVKDINPAGTSQSQYSREELLGKSIFTALPQIFDTSFLELLQRVHLTEFPEQYPVTKFENGSIQLWVESYVFKLPTGEIVVVYDDITERKKIEEDRFRSGVSLKKSQEEWKNTFNAMDDIITIQDKYMNIIKANKAFYNTFPELSEGLPLPPCYEIFHSDKKICVPCPAHRTLFDGNIHREEITDEVTGKTYSVSTCPILSEDGSFEHIVHIVKDITESKKLEEELFQSHKMEAIGTLAGGIAHDFNNILSAIMGYAEFIKEDAPTGGQLGEDASEILIATNRAKDLVKQILTFSRKNDQVKNVIEPHLVVLEALNMLRSTLPTSVTMEEVIQTDCGTVLANATNLHQVILNLCANARHAMIDDKGVINVELKRVERTAEQVPHEKDIKPGCFVELLVSDNGCGISPEDLERIFEPYYTTRDVGVGSGLGLSVTHGIVEDCNGFIEVDSTVGEGTSFSVYLPCHEEGENVDKQTPTEKKPVQTGTGGQILLVDDEPLLLDINSRRLMQLGYQVVMTESSRRALDLFIQDPNAFDLLITDQSMPELTGEDLARAVLKRQPSFPIIVCTGYSESFTEDKAYAMGIKKYVLKPVLGDELMDAVRDVLGS